MEKILHKRIWTDYYLSDFKWYRNWRKVTWYKHILTRDALQIQLPQGKTFWALYGDINRYSKVVETEYFKTK